MKLNKKQSIKKWNQFIDENSQIFEDFKDKSFPVLLKKIYSLIRKDIINNGDNFFNNNYQIDSFNIDIVINYQKGNKEPYYSNINIYDILTEPEKPVIIPVKIVDDKIDIDYLMSIISHEIRHIYDIYTVSGDVEIQEFVKSMTISKFKNKCPEFVELVYLSLEHELITRHNMLYEMYRYINIIDKDKLFEIFKKSFVYEALTKLQNFDYLEFIKKPDILEFTKEFSESIGDQFDGDLIKYYSNWNNFFKQKSQEFIEYVNDILDDIIEDVKNNEIYERLCGYISYNEDIGNKVSLKIFEKLIENKNENFKL